jgi:hypothetical protein
MPLEAAVCHGASIIPCTHVLFKVLLAVQHLLTDKDLWQAPAAQATISRCCSGGNTMMINR